MALFHFFSYVMSLVFDKFDHFFLKLLCVLVFREGVIYWFTSYTSADLTMTSGGKWIENKIKKRRVIDG